MDQLKIWEEQIRRGGSTKDKYTTIDKWTHDRFVEARQSNQQVTTRNLQQWDLAAASQFPDLEFKASEAWVKIFKRKHRIRQRKITKFVSERKTATMEETHAAAEKFRLHTRALILNYDKDFVLNTDQTGCQYQSTYNRTLAEQGSKVVLVKRKDMNKVTHSYTAQYVMTLSGKLLPMVFICLQEANGNFGPKVQKSVDEYAKIYTNVAITSSKSGKLTTALYKDFLIDVMKPYVKEEKFLFLIDSWGGQTNPVLYDEIFTDDKGIPTCTMKVIPPKCTPLVQPCDVYFYREANPQVYVETPLHPEKLTVLCALWAGGIIGPYFFKKDEGHNVTVNGDRYRFMITNFFISELNNHDVQELWFQQDGATCHTARASIDLLKDTFSDHLISRFGPVNWPPRSCDLTPLDYFLWGYVKSLVYADKPQTLDHLEDNIYRVIADNTATNVGKIHRKLFVQIGLHPSQPLQSYTRNHI
ncbi:HTH CENPB-type domain-containing protein [Trichonephila clavipes]|nr:HTH CENPB-type domain-containing protein [Trichonephila clavipes]